MKAKLYNPLRVISLMLCLAMILSIFPITEIPMSAVVNTPYTTTSDPSTLNAWTKYFGTDASGNLST